MLVTTVSSLSLAVNSVYVFVSLISGGLHFGECLEYGWFKYINLCTAHATLCLLPLCQ